MLIALSEACNPFLMRQQRRLSEVVFLIRSRLNVQYNNSNEKWAEEGTLNKCTERECDGRTI